CTKRLRDRLGPASPRRGTAPGRWLRRVLLPVRRGDRVGASCLRPWMAPSPGRVGDRRPRRRRNELRSAGARSALPRLPGALPPSAPRRLGVAAGTDRTGGRSPCPARALAVGSGQGGGCTLPAVRPGSDAHGGQGATQGRARERCASGGGVRTGWPGRLLHGLGWV